MDSSDLTRVVDALTRLRFAVDEAFERSGGAPVSGSIAATEVASFPREELVRTAYAQGRILITVAADLLASLARSVTEPVLTIAPWVEVRSLVEASAVSAWLLNPWIGAKARVGRSYAFRYRGLQEQITFGRVISSQRVVNKATARTQKLLADSADLQYKAILNKKQKVTGIGERMPPATELVRESLDEEWLYRLLSAMAHGHTWAVQQLGFAKSEDDTGPFLEKSISPMAVLLLVMKAVRSFTLPVRYQLQLFGWNPRDCFSAEADVLMLLKRIRGDGHQTPRWE